MHEVDYYTDPDGRTWKKRHKDGKYEDIIFLDPEPLEFPYHEEKPMENSTDAIFIAPTIEWGRARARDLNYEINQCLIVSFKLHRAMSTMYGMKPNDDGEPVIYLCAWTEFQDGVDTPMKREWRDAINRARSIGFEIIDLDKAGLTG